MNQLERIRARWTAGEAWFDGRSQREKIQVAGAAAAAILALWLVLLHQPVSSRHGEAVGAVELATAESERLSTELDALGSAGGDPQSQQRAGVETLEVEIRELSARATAEGSSVLPPREVVALLRELCEAHPDLRLVRIESSKPEPAMVQREGAESALPTKLFRHSIEIEIEGPYLPALRWLGTVAGLPWKLRWDELRYDVLEHPRARIVLRLHTLGREQEWIRA